MRQIALLLLGLTTTAYAAPASSNRVTKILERRQVMNAEVVNMGTCQQNMVFPGQTLEIQEKQVVRTYLVNATFEKNAFGMETLVGEEMIPQTLAVSKDVIASRVIEFSPYASDATLRDCGKWKAYHQTLMASSGNQRPSEPGEISARPQTGIAPSTPAAPGPSASVEQ